MNEEQQQIGADKQIADVVSDSTREEVEEDYKIEYEFKIEGMTCVACSGSIERGMRNEFADKGLVFDEATQTYAVNVILLMHKMKITFFKRKSDEKKVTPKKIEDEVEDLGFGAKLINTTELRKPKQKDEESNSILSVKLKKCVLIIADYGTQEKDLKLHQAMQKIKQQTVGVESFDLNILTSSVKVTYDQNRCTPRDLIVKLEDLGFSAELRIKDNDSDIRKITYDEVLKYKWKVIICAILYFPLIFCIWCVPYITALDDFMLAGNIWRGNTFYVFLCFIFSSIIQFYSGKQFYSSAWKSLKHKSANMDVLIVTGTTAAYSYGIILMITGFPDKLVHYYNDEMKHKYHMMIHSHVHNFETSSVLILIVLIGKLIETYSKMKTIGQLSKLASLKVHRANLIQETDADKVDLTCTFREIQVELLNLKDFVLVQPGGAIPTDGIVIFGHGCTNESMLTGESRPQTKDIGKRVFGGSILTQGTIIFEVDKLAEDATYNQIMKMVENAQNTKAPIQGVADKISAFFVPTIVALAVVAWIVWFAIVYSSNKVMVNSMKSRFQFAFDFGISTLVIACPCALGLATPTAVMVGTGLAASKGILIKGADILEKIKKINTIVFDKTGTLTAGKPHLKDIISCFEQFKVTKAVQDMNKLLHLLWLTEMNSEHPVALAIRVGVQSKINGESQDKMKVISSNNIDGEGIKVEMIDEKEQKRTVLCGNIKLMRNQRVLTNDAQYAEIIKNVTYLEEQGKTVVILALDQIPQLIISLEEAHLAKESSLMVVNYLKSLGMRVCMITGDNEHTAIKVAQYLGIEEKDVYSEANPEKKKLIVEEYQKKGDKVMFVGDGINDSPVLAQAEIGCAINSQSDITVSAASIVLIKDDLIDVIRAILISKKSFQRIKINFGFAFVYNTVLIPVAMGVFYPIGIKLDPMFAAVAMGLSSISVVTSSLLLRLYNPDSYIYPIGRNKVSVDNSIKEPSYNHLQSVSVSDQILNTDDENSIENLSDQLIQADNLKQNNMNKDNQALGFNPNIN